MAAAQQKKRLLNSRTQEHYKGKKKKKVDSSDYLLNLRPRVHLEWDDRQKTVVAKREQIGITWSDMAPFLDSLPPNCKGVADVLSVPKAMFGLDDLMDVLSYEVWATCLSESERKLLAQFLPHKSRPEQTVYSLLTGENHHFGNPFLKWSTSLRSGNLHPNDVVQKERQIRTSKKLYYSELNKYHTDMLDGLMKWKERWSTCKDPEKLWSRGVSKHKQRALSVCIEKTKISPVPKREISNRTFTRNGDVAKYMSYMKISKKQHEAIKNLRHSADGIQTKSLSRVLGDIKGFHVLPFETLLEDEKTRLHQHWLQLVTRELPMAFEAHQEEKLQRKQLKKCLEQELSEKNAVISDKAETDNQESSPREQREEDDGTVYQPVESIIEEDVASTPVSSHYPHMTGIPYLNSHQEPSTTASNQIVGGSDSLSLGNNSPVLSQFCGRFDLVESESESKASTLYPKDIWKAADSNRCKFSNDTSQGRSLSIEECRAPMVDLERDVMEQEADQSNDSSLFPSYATQSQDNLLVPFPKGPELLSSYAPDKQINCVKQPELQFLMTNDQYSEPLQFPPQSCEQQSLIQHSREKQFYMHQMMNKNLRSNGRYPNQEICSSVNDTLVAHNSFPGDLRTRNNYWSGVMPSNSSGPQCLGGNTDGSLYSILSGCRNLPSGSLYDTTGPEQLSVASNFIPDDGRIYGFAPHQFKSSNSHEPTAPVPPVLNIPWMNHPPHQNSSMQDSMGKPFLRSWNQ